MKPLKLNGRFTIRNRNLRKENRMSRKIGLALMVAAGLPVCAARAAEVSSGAEFAAALAGGESEIALTRDIMLVSGIGTQHAE